MTNSKQQTTYAHHLLVVLLLTAAGRARARAFASHLVYYFSVSESEAQTSDENGELIVWPSLVFLFCWAGTGSVFVAAVVAFGSRRELRDWREGSRS